jgi:hypothetical protein
LRTKGYSYEMITRKLSIPKSIMKGIVKRYIGHGIVQDLPRLDRPGVMDVRDDHLVLRLLNKKGCGTKATITRRLKKIGICVVMRLYVGALEGRGSMFE